MDVDLQSRAVSFRILYAGPPGATKFLNLRGLHSAAREDEREDLTIFHTGGDRFVAFPFTPRTEQALGGLQVSFTAVGMPGEIHSRGAQRLLMMTADALVFLPDRNAPGGSETAESFRQLMEDLAIIDRDPATLPIIVQDYRDAEGQLDAQDLARVPEGARTQRVSVEGDTIEGVLQVFDIAREQVLQRYQGIDPEMNPVEGEILLRARAWSRPPDEVASPEGRPKVRLERALAVLLAAILFILCAAILLES